jgi:hypothetical protein
VDRKLIDEAKAKASALAGDAPGLAEYVLNVVEAEYPRKLDSQADELDKRVAVAVGLGLVRWKEFLRELYAPVLSSLALDLRHTIVKQIDPSIATKAFDSRLTEEWSHGSTRADGREIESAHEVSEGSAIASADPRSVTFANGKRYTRLELRARIRPLTISSQLAIEKFMDSFPRVPADTNY